MTSLSLRRKLSSTAFLSHWCVVHWPTPSRVATREGVGQWTTHQWLKKAVLLSFRLSDNEVIRAGDLGFYDKVQTKFTHLDEEKMRATGVRVVPPAVARRGSFIAKGAILMPSFVNIGAY